MEKAIKPAPGKNGFKYRQQWAVIVICEGEAHQKTVFDALKAQGFKLKVVVV